MDGYTHETSGHTHERQAYPHITSDIRTIQQPNRTKTEKATLISQSA